MNARTFIEKIRDHYIEQFRLFIRQQTQSCTRGAAEVKFRIENSSLFQGLYCVDFVKNDAGTEITELAADMIHSVEVVSETIGNTRLSLERVHWDDVVLNHDAGDISGDDISEWFRRWFDPDDQRHDPSSELSNAIHSLTVRTGELQIDFGTAHSDAFWDAISLLQRHGATSIWVRSSRSAAGGTT